MVKVLYLKKWVQLSPTFRSSKCFVSNIKMDCEIRMVVPIFAQAHFYHWAAGGPASSESRPGGASSADRRAKGHRHRLRYNGLGGMAEWSKAAVLKTVSGVTRSGVRIPLPPP